MGFLSDYTSAKFLGASTDDAMKYAAVKSFLSSDQPNNNATQNTNTNHYYYDDKKKRSGKNEQQQLPKKTQPKGPVLPIVEEELTELQKPVAFDDKNLPMDYMKTEAKKEFQKGKGIFNERCIIKMNEIQKKYLENYINELLHCNTIQEIQKIHLLYIYSGLSYLDYFTLYTNNINQIKIHFQRILTMKINYV
ncbi:hypothetical protein [Treponema sp. Marseille-Q3903]|uniref:hypothetical protein n=1 Tax=Treponema sp. Marseille-Q3903 TaxID=2766703 RepID=UPI001652A7CF|nr:hypothetical protein [Treponema sp. Marseille-Q3903]MBC6713589.1 hypothetical protein [Treponema sp. Marseille-Q3903]